MTLNRRAFLTGLIAAPAIIAADRLMRLPKREIIKPKGFLIVESGWNDLHADGTHPTHEAYIQQLVAYCDARRAAGWKVATIGPYSRLG